jgi:hypothetical protein
MRLLAARLTALYASAAQVGFARIYPAVVVEVGSHHKLIDLIGITSRGAPIGPDQFVASPPG